MKIKRFPRNHDFESNTKLFFLYIGRGAAFSTSRISQNF